MKDPDDIMKKYFEYINNNAYQKARLFFSEKYFSEANLRKIFSHKERLGYFENYKFIRSGKEWIMDESKKEYSYFIYKTRYSKYKAQELYMLEKIDDKYIIIRYRIDLEK